MIFNWYKTTDGSLTWQQVVPAGHFKDILYNPGDQSIVYASTYNFFGGARIFKSTDGGDSFITLSNTGMLPSQICRIKLGVSPDNPQIVYALNCSSNTFGLDGFYKSVDEGENWDKTISGNDLDLVGYSAAGANQGGQGFYNLSLAVSPSDADEILVGGTHIWRSSDGGETFTLNDNCYQIAYDWIHADIHEFTYHPLNGHLYAGCDGGIYKSVDNGLNWIDISEGIQITQSYRLGISQLDQDLLIIGNQDNASFLKKDEEWYGVIGGDGMECMIDYTDTEIIYASIQFGALYRSINGGSSFSNISPDNAGNAAWTAPFLMHPTNHEILYAGYSNIYKSYDMGLNWEQVSNNFSNGALLHRIEIAPSDDNYIYAASYANIWKSKDGGISWTEISSGLPNFSFPPVPFDMLTFYDIEVSPNDPNTFWVTYSNFMAENKVFKSIDGGDTWMNITYNLPNFPVNCIVQQTNTDDGVYVGTDVGVYYIDNNLDTWFDVSNGLPNVVVTDMEINYASNTLVAATHGRGVWETELFNPITNVNQTSMIEKFSIFPNPARNKVLIQLMLNGSSDLQVSIKDLQGRILHSKNIEYCTGQKNITFDVADLSQGVYLIDLKSLGNILQTKKLIKL